MITMGTTSMLIAMIYGHGMRWWISQVVSRVRSDMVVYSDK